MIALEHVSFRHPGAGQDSLVDVSLGLEGGAVVGLAGPSGAGLSTLCQVVSGLAPRVTGGELRGVVRVDGADTVAWPMHRMAEHVVLGVADPAAQLSLVADTVYEEVAFGPANLGLPLGDVLERVDEALQHLGIADLAARDPCQLSGGQQQLVVLASLLAMRPGALVLDEPVAHLDADGTRRVLEAVAGAAARGAGVLLAERRDDVLARATRGLVVLEGGQVVANGHTGDVLADPALARLGLRLPLERRLAAPADRAEAAMAPSIVAGARAPVDLRLEDVSFEYPSGSRALVAVDLAIPGGQSVALVGANGSGKSTLLRHLDGLLRPTAGRVLVDGVDAASLTVAQLAHDVGLAFQAPDRQLFGRTVRAEVAFGPRSLGLGGAALEAAVRAALGSVGLDGVGLNVLESHPADLGAASRKLLTLASVLAMATPIVALDEPTVGLDAPGRARVEAILTGLRAAGRTVIVATHDMDLVARVADRVVALRGGRVVLDGPPLEVFATRSWPDLRAAGLDPPDAARLGDRLGLGVTPTEAALRAALAAAPGR